LDGVDGVFLDGRISHRDARKRVLSLTAATEPNNRLSKSTVTQGFDGRPGMIQSEESSTGIIKLGNER